MEDPVASPDPGTVNIVKYEDQRVEIDCRINRACFLLTRHLSPCLEGVCAG